MIDQMLAGAIWDCHREIVAAEKLLTDLAQVEEELRRNGDQQFAQLRDAFGRRKNLTLGIPSGESSHRLFDVAPELAKSVIRAHMANKQAELVRLNEQAWIALGELRSTVHEASNGSA